MRSAGADRGRWLWPALPVTVLFAANVLRGANTTVAALILALAEALILAGFLSSARLRCGLREVPGLLPIGTLFAITLTLAIWSTQPTSSGPVAELRQSLGQPGAASLDISNTLVEIAKLLGLASMFLVGAMIGARRALRRPLVRLFLGFGAAFGLFAITLFGAGLQPAMPGLLSGEFLSHNTAGTLFGMLTVLAAAQIRFDRPSSFRGAYGRRIGAELITVAPSLVLTLGFAACLVLTGSRGAWIATLCGLMTFALLRSAKSRSRWIATGVSVLALLAVSFWLLATSGPNVTQRLAGLEPDMQGRAETLAAHWRWVQKSPWRGWGLGAFDHLNVLTLTPGAFTERWDLRAAHNAAVQWLEEAGGLGTAAMALFVVFIVGRVAIYTLRANKFRPWMTGLLAVDAVVLVHSLDDYALQVPSMAGFWALLLGIQVARAK